MAFDQQDTDKIYDRQVAPVLKRNGITPIIISKRQTNRDLNIEIIHQLDSCDFCIADLTYARPSVYFEAGYAQRRVEVIYMARRDHVKRDQEDNRRVHFDLQMKPLILWSNPGDTTFSTRLETRIRSTFLRGYRKQQQLDHKARFERRRFAALSVDTRRSAMLRAGIRQLRRDGFRTWTLDRMGDTSWYAKTRDVPNRPRYRAGPRHVLKDPSKFTNMPLRWNRFEAERVRASKYVAVSLVADNGFTKRFIKNYLEALMNTHQYGADSKVRLCLAKEANLGQIDEIQQHHVFLALSRVPENRVMSALTGFHRGKRSGDVFRSYSLPFSMPSETTLHIPYRVHFHFFGAIDSETAVLNHLRELVESIDHS